VTEEVYNIYKMKFGKMYSDEESKFRYQLFKTFIGKMVEHNKGDNTWKMGINMFSDMTKEEFKSKYLG
jgi:hypothetical protein